MQQQQTLLNLLKEEKIATPLTEVLSNQTIPATRQATETSSTLKNSLDALFPEQQQDDKDIRKSREILGDLADNFTPEELNAEIAKIKFLCESWMDDFERQVFNGITLQELLHEKGGK